MESLSRTSLTRRAALRGAVAASGLALTQPAARMSAQGTTPAPAGALTDDLVQAFLTDVEEALATFRVPGAAVALVQGDDVVFAGGFGMRELGNPAPVSERTRFRIASNTKSMTSLLIATLVDEGVVAWDDRVVDLWPEFRAPSDELTATLRLRDLFGMATGIVESPTIEFFMTGGSFSALDILRSVAYLDAAAPPDEAYAYNNTLYGVAASLGLLAQGTSPGDLERAYASQVAARIFEPIGMADAAITADPRPLGDAAVGHTYDLFDEPSHVPFGSIDGAAPAGEAVASATDMARYLLTQIHGGVTPGGDRIVSAANLEETHRPGISFPAEGPQALPPLLLTDTTSIHYCMGWIDQTFTGGRHMLWHSGGIDGFASIMGFFPEDEIGYAILTNLEPAGGGSLFTIALQSSLLNRLYGLRDGVAETIADAVPDLAAARAEVAAQLQPADVGDVGPFLGQYSSGFFLRADDAGNLWLDHDIRSLSLMMHADGWYVIANGPGIVLGRSVELYRDDFGHPAINIDGFEPLRWLTAG